MHVMVRRSVAAKSRVLLGRRRTAAVILLGMIAAATAGHAQTPGAASPPAPRNASPAPGGVLIPPPAGATAPLEVAPGGEAPPLIAPSPADKDLPLKPPAAGATTPPLRLAPVEPRK
jgi:hypothetical protein